MYFIAFVPCGKQAQYTDNTLMPSQPSSDRLSHSHQAGITTIIHNLLSMKIAVSSNSIKYIKLLHNDLRNRLRQVDILYFRKRKSAHLKDTSHIQAVETRSELCGSNTSGKMMTTRNVWVRLGETRRACMCQMPICAANTAIR